MIRPQASDSTTVQSPSMGKPNTVKPSSSTNSSSTPTIKTAHLLTYKWHDQMSFVLPAASHGQAVAFAKEAFRDLQAVSDDQIAFSVMSTMNTTNKKLSIAIAPAAWHSLTKRLKDGEVVHVNVHPLPGSSEEKPPVYSSTPEWLAVDEKSRHSRSPSPAPRSRSSSPLPRSLNLADKARDWVGRHL